MRRFIGLMIACLLYSNLYMEARSAVGTWRSYPAYHNATQCVAVIDKVYVLSDGSLYSYTPDDEFVETYDKTNLLSDQGIYYIAADEKSNALMVLYANANIDLIYPDGKVRNVTDFANKTTLDPTVNDLRIIDGEAYLATNFGLTILNVKRGEFGGTYMLNKITHSCVELNDIIYAATEEGLYFGNKDDNLLDVSHWHKLSSDIYAMLDVFDGQLVALKEKESTYIINTTDGTATLLRRGPLNFMHNTDGHLFVGNNTNVFVYNKMNEFIQLSLDGTVEFLTTDGTTFWTANKTAGLNGYRYNKESKNAEQVVSKVLPNSPMRNYCQYLNFVDDERLLVAGGCLNYFGTTFLEGTLMMYEEDTWTTFQEEEIAAQTKIPYNNMTSLVQDPKDENHHYASSFGQGIYEFRNGEFVAHYSDHNSILESAIPGTKNYTRISRLQYDKEGNLWIVNADGENIENHKYNNVDSPLKILKPDGSMVSLYYKELKNQATLTDILFTDNHRMWVVGRRLDASLFCIDTKGTTEDVSDDDIKAFGPKFTDQDGNVEEVNYVNAIAEDFNGDLWVMTDKGPYVLYNTERVFDEDYHFNKIKVPRNDGTNYADYLLNGVYTTCVIVDDANRKWIGTINNGLYLITSDGLETVHHFTKDNSPLPSNAIESLALQHSTGELFIGTDKGLVSYTTDAIRGENQYIEEKVYAYPNPVTPDYNGLITIVGLKANTHVKITNTAGRLIAEGTSLGGSFTWDGKTLYGQRVSTGIYYVLGCDEEGNEGIVTKILFVK